MTTALEREFLLKLAAAPRPASSIEELNEGLLPQWQIAAVGVLMTGGLIEEVGCDNRGHPRYGLTADGWEAIDVRPPARESGRPAGKSHGVRVPLNGRYRRN